MFVWGGCTTQSTHKGYVKHGQLADSHFSGTSLVLKVIN